MPPERTEGAETRLPEAYLVEQVHQALAQDPRAAELDVHVAIAGRKVVLTGTVATAERREVVAAVAREAVPGYEVVNQTSVYRRDEATEVEQL